MAGRGLGTLTLDLAVKTGAFEQGLDKAGRSLDKRARHMERVTTPRPSPLSSSIPQTNTSALVAVEAIGQQIAKFALFGRRIQRHDVEEIDIRDG